MVALNNIHCIIAAISVYGRYDGFLLIENENIHYISQQAKYEEKLVQLYKQYGIMHKSFDFAGIDLISELLVIAKDERFIVSLELQHSNNYDIIGFVEQLDNDICTIYMVSENGEFEGYSYVDTDKITELSCDPEKNRVRQFLFKSK